MEAEEVPGRGKCRDARAEAVHRGKSQESIRMRKAPNQGSDRGDWAWTEEGRDGCRGPEEMLGDARHREWRRR